MELTFFPISNTAGKAPPGPSSIASGVSSWSHLLEVLDVHGAIRLAGVVAAWAAWPARLNTEDGAELHGSRGWTAVPYLTLVTLGCTLFDIASSVRGVGLGCRQPDSGCADRVIGG